MNREEGICNGELCFFLFFFFSLESPALTLGQRITRETAFLPATAPNTIAQLAFQAHPKNPFKSPWLLKFTAPKNLHRNWFDEAVSESELDVCLCIYIE